MRTMVDRVDRAAGCRVDASRVGVEAAGGRKGRRCAQHGLGDRGGKGGVVLGSSLAGSTTVDLAALTPTC